MNYFPVEILRPAFIIKRPAVAGAVLQTPLLGKGKKNPTYGRHWISWPMRIVSPLHWIFFWYLYFIEGVKNCLAGRLKEFKKIDTKQKYWVIGFKKNVEGDQFLFCFVKGYTFFWRGPHIFVLLGGPIFFSSSFLWGVTFSLEGSNPVLKRLIILELYNNCQFVYLFMVNSLEFCQCCAVQCSAVQCSAVQCTAVLCQNGA